MLKELAIIVGTIIGAGILSLPYVVHKAGYFVGFFWLIFSYFIILTIHLMLGEICLRTSEIHQIPGYIKKYLGERAYIFSFFINIISLYGTIIAYLLIQTEAFSLIFGVSQEIVAILISIFILLILYFGLYFMEDVEVAFNFLNFSIILGTSLFIITTNSLKFQNIFYINPKYFFYPLGSSIFSFIGINAIPLVRKALLNRENILKKVVFLGTTIPLFLYILFVTSFVLFLEKVPEKAIFALGPLGFVLSILFVFPPFIALSFAIKDIYQYDLKINKKISIFLSVSIPLIVFLMIYNIKEIFIKVVSIFGTFFLLAMCPLFILTYFKAKRKYDRKPEYELKIHPIIFALIYVFIFIASIFEIILLI